MEQAYENCVVANQSSYELRKANFDISCSVVIGCKNHYRRYKWIEPKDVAEQRPEYVGSEEIRDDNGLFWVMKNGWVLDCYKEFHADGSVCTHYIDGKEEHDTWSSTFDETYKKLKFDQITGWSRWIEINEQEAVEFSPETMAFNISADGFSIE